MKLTIWSALVNEIWRREMMCFNSVHNSYGFFYFISHIACVEQSHEQLLITVMFNSICCVNKNTYENQ